jgi:NAD(P)-dependent dehydrogenase (short-subunit alcohol dehydrogenase family)
MHEGNAQRVAVITGGTHGIGQAVAQLFRARGYAVEIWDLEGERPNGDQLPELSPATGQIFYKKVDVGDFLQVQKAASETTQHFKRLDFLFCGAGILGPDSWLESWQPEPIEAVLRVNLLGTMWACQALLPLFKSSGGGSILTVGSLAAQHPSPQFAAYAAAKAGVATFTRALARRLGRHQVRINCVQPGSIEGTKLRLPTYKRQQLSQQERLSLMARIPTARIGQPADIAELAYFLASDQARHIHGALIDIDG